MHFVVLIFFADSKPIEGNMLNVEHFNVMLISKVAAFVVEE